MLVEQAPQTLTQLLAPYIPLLTPATLLGLAWKISRSLTKGEDRILAVEVKVNEMHKATTNDIPHSLEEIARSNDAVKDEVHGLREDMKFMFTARTAIDSARPHVVATAHVEGSPEV